jgi:hypothetical protein
VARSGDHLARHFADAPLLIGYGRNRDGSGVHPALWSAMLAARADGVGATLTGVMQTFVADEVSEILGMPKDEGWYLHGVVPIGYPPADGGRSSYAGPRGCRPQRLGRRPGVHRAGTVVAGSPDP